MRDRTPITPIVVMEEEVKTEAPVWMYYCETEQVVPELEEHVNYADEQIEYDDFVDNYEPVFFTADEIINCKISL